MSHSGDQRDGSDVGFDEVITINLDTIPFHIQYLPIMITSSKGQGFSNISTGSISLIQNDNTLLEVSLNGITSDYEANSCV
jgi:stress response protein SCP2